MIALGFVHHPAFAIQSAVRATGNGKIVNLDAVELPDRYFDNVAGVEHHLPLRNRKNCLVSRAFVSERYVSVRKFPLPHAGLKNTSSERRWRE